MVSTVKVATVITGVYIVMGMCGTNLNNLLSTVPATDPSLTINGKVVAAVKAYRVKFIRTAK